MSSTSVKMFSADVFGVFFVSSRSPSTMKLREYNVLLLESELTSGLA